jgi:hypothetical protein
MNGVIRTVKLSMLVGTFLSVSAAHAESFPRYALPLSLAQLSTVPSSANDSNATGMLELPDLPSDNNVVSEPQRPIPLEPLAPIEPLEMQNDSGKAFSFDNQNVNDQEPSIMDIAPPPPPASVGNQVEDGLSPDDAMQMDLPPLPGEAGAAPVSEPSQGAEAAQTAEEQLGAPIFPEDSGTVFDIFDPQPTVVAPKKQKAEPAPPKQEPEKKAVSKPVRTEPRVKLPTEYRLPAKIYKKEYDKLNRHLPEARYEHE